MPIDSPAVLVPTHPVVAELDLLGAEIAELSAHLDAATARLLTLIREFDARGGWNSGFRSCAEWLGWRVGLDVGAARERVRVARALGTLPLLSDALTRVATPETEARLLAVGRAGTAAHVERIVRGWRRVDRQAEAREAARRHASRALHVHHTEDGMVMLRGRLEPQVGALLMQALAAAREALYQRARARAAAAGATDRSQEPPTPAVHVDAPALADPEQPGQSALEDGTHVSAETSRRLACDASRVVMRHDEEGRVVEIGARTRTIPPALRRALHHRDHGCRFPGCGVRFGQGHHLQHWAQGGPTTLSNLALLCRRRGGPTGRSSSSGRTAARFPRCHRLRRSPRIPSRFSGRITTRTVFRSTRERVARAGSGSGWMSDGRSTCCTLAARNCAPDLDAGGGSGRRAPAPPRDAPRT